MKPSTEPNAATFVFFHVGHDTTLPSMLVDSIRWTNRSATILFCTDAATPDIEGVDRRIEVPGDRKTLMTYRLDAFSRCGLEYPAIYLDTDMLVTREIRPIELLGTAKIAMCQRFFSRDAAFNGNFRGLDFREYDQQPLGKVYPYVACCTVTENAKVWSSLLAILVNLHPKFHLWYGDQEAMRHFAQQHSDWVLGLPEHTYGCLPEANEYVQRAAIIHFKGPARKPLMQTVHEQLRARARQ